MRETCSERRCFSEGRPQRELGEGLVEVAPLGENIQSQKHTRGRLRDLFVKKGHVGSESTRPADRFPARLKGANAMSYCTHALVVFVFPRQDPKALIVRVVRALKPLFLKPQTAPKPEAGFAGEDEMLRHGVRGHEGGGEVSSWAYYLRC